MRFAEADAEGARLVEAYGPEGILVAGQRYRCGIILTGERILADWGPDRIEELTLAHLDRLLDLAPQVIVLGTGAAQVFPDPELWARPLQQGIGMEIMDTGAACRTYNILVAEGRRVAAGLLPLTTLALTTLALTTLG